MTLILSGTAVWGSRATPLFTAALWAMLLCNAEAILGFTVFCPVSAEYGSLKRGMGFPWASAEEKGRRRGSCAAGRDPMGPARRMAATHETIRIR
jgi:hypothetical protein